MKTLKNLVFFVNILLLVGCNESEEPIDHPINISEIPNRLANYSWSSSDVIEIPYSVIGLGGIADFSAIINDTELIDLTEFTNDDLTTFPESIAGILTLPKELFPTMPIELFPGKTIVKFLATDQNNSKDSLIMEVIEIRSMRGDISKDTTLTNDFIHRLDTRVTVNPGVTLTIEAGTIIKGNTGQAAAATAIFISRGARIKAMGTPEAPIIMTSVLDEIQPGELISPNLDPSVTGLWGGLYVLGAARVSCGECMVESIVTTDARQLYGGTNDYDDSGEIHYLSIRHGSTSIGAGNEMAGITFAAVGARTVVDHLEMVGNASEGIEFIGGAVNVDHILTWNSNNNAIMCNEGYTGSIENFIAINPGNNALNLTGPPGGTQAAVAGYEVSNGFIYLNSCKGGYYDTANATVTVSNVYFTGFIESTGFESQYYENGTFTASNLQMDNRFVGSSSNNSITVAEYFSDMVDKVDANGNPVMKTVDPGSQTVGPKSSAGFEWTWAYKSGKLAEIGLE